MKKLVWVAGVLLLLSVVFPNGIKLPVPTPVVVEPVGETDAQIVALLKTASTDDKNRVVSIYSGLKFVLQRDKGQRVNTTEKWAELQANTLQLAVEQVGKYPGLDVAINDVFKRVVGTDDVLPANADTQTKLIKACDIIADSAR